MNNSRHCLSDGKSNSEIVSYIFSEGMPLDESFDSEQNSKSNKPSKKSKKNKFLSVKTRKRKEDNIRKKIKTSALRNIIKKINKNLTKAGSKYTFKALPQHFIADISRKTNHEVMHLTLRELIEYTYMKLIKDEKYNKKVHNKTLIKAAKEKYKNNCQVLEYLDSIQEINLKSVWEQIRSSKYVDLLSDFFLSNEYEKSVEKLKEDKYYVESYKYFAETYVEFFLNYEPIEENNTIDPIPIVNLNKEQNINTPIPEPNNINHNVIQNPESNTLLEIIINNESPSPDPPNLNDNGVPDHNNSNDNDASDLEFNPNIFNPHPTRDWLDFPIVSFNAMPFYFLMSEDIDLLESFNSSSEAVIKRENRFLTIF